MNLEMYLNKVRKLKRKEETYENILQANPKVIPEFSSLSIFEQEEILTWGNNSRKKNI